VTLTPPILGLILAGGLGRRMGGVDKPLLPLGGEPLLARIAARLRPQCPAGVALSANGDPARFRGIFDGPVLPDSLPGRPGPLAGILAGLEHAADRPGVTHLLSVPGDTPFLPGDLAARLTESRGTSAIAVAASGGREHYTAALWPLDLRDDLQAWLEAGERRVGAFIARHGAAVVEWPTEPVDPFLNLNAPEDLLRAENIVQTQSSS
jgi:molybdenum cofactor guanylyltransferase